MAQIKILFFGDIFGQPGIDSVEKILPILKHKHNIDFVLAQGENISGRKGLNLQDYKKLKTIGIDAFTIGNHIWANEEIYSFVDNEDIIRPLNINDTYPGSGVRYFKVKNHTLAIVSLMGVAFNPLLKPWKEEYANNFFDSIDHFLSNNTSDFTIVDFHAETTSEKNVFALYVDGQVDAVCGTHTHVQTSDARKLPNNTLYITDVGMCGPQDSAIGANFNEVYQKMRFDSWERFQVSPNNTQINAVILTLNTNKFKSKIKTINLRDVIVY
ncbi:TIGR00282 family metallophosphoesterase [Mycoplasmopsis cricetuli]|uniref:TIGR00282 family metallophosphoesterase n=1 Tax=Mycoplasmopsis cricetuli TaxID=171283 RepID=UPI000563E6EB|nr:TIGR00282 family metallophosphoesterase [Mycoplasmopsis cricetuli]